MYRKLRGRIVEKYGSLTEFATALGISRAMISKYLNGKAVFNTVSMDRWGKLLEIERSDYSAYFFAD